jgi:hypothetical protein
MEETAPNIGLVNKIESWIAVYVRGPGSDWCKINVDQFGPFEETVQTVRNIMNKHN